MSVSSFVYEPLSFISPLLLLKNSPREVSFNKQNLFLQDSAQVERASACIQLLEKHLSIEEGSQSPLQILLIHAAQLSKADTITPVIAAMGQAFFKQEGYFARLFSQETWAEWLENRTSLGRVAALFTDCITSQTQLRAFEEKLNVQEIQQANEEAEALLQKIRLSQSMTHVNSKAHRNIIHLQTQSLCTISVISGLTASIASKNPVPFLMGLGGCLPRAEAQQKVGSEFHVNTFTTNHQLNPSVAEMSNGDFVVIWQSDDGSGYGIFGQLFDGDATKIGKEFQINNYTIKSQTSPSVTDISNGNFVVIWRSRDHDGSWDGIFGQLFTAEGFKIGNEFQVNTYKSLNQLYTAVSSLSNDNFVVTWDSQYQDGSDYGVFGQLFNGNSTKIGSEFQINTFTNLTQISSSVTCLNNSNFVVTWSSENQDGSYSGIFGQLFDGNGSKIGNEFQVNTYTSNNQWYSTIASLSNGNFVVTWESSWQDWSLSGIFGQLFSKNGSKIEKEFQVNTYTNNSQRMPSVASLGNGNFVVTWTSEEQDGSDHGIFGQLFSVNASKIGTEFQVNTYTNNSQSKPSVASLGNGNFVVTWSSNEQDGSGYGVFGQMFNDKLVINMPTLTTHFQVSELKRASSTIWISLFVGGPLCFCISFLGLFLLRKRKLQEEVRFSEKKDVFSTPFELEPVVMRHKVIGETYFLLSTLVREEVEEIYLQTGHLISFPEGKTKFPYVIGSGQFGKIKVAQRIEDRQYVASKKVKGEENMRASEAEAQMQQAAAGDNVLPIYNTMRFEDALYHFMPLAGLGNGIAIQRWLAMCNQSSFSLTILTFIAQNILTGLQTIHAKRIYHLDIKPDNLVFTKDGTAYITDFGCAKRLTDTCLPGGALGDNRYFSPERLQSCKGGTFDAEKTDLWAAGVTLLQILYNQNPLDLLKMPQELAARVEECNHTHFNKQLQRFYDGGKGSIWWVIKGLLNINPKTRFTATQALEASCFRRLDKTQQERAFEALRREILAQYHGIEASQVDLCDYKWASEKAPEEARAQAYNSEHNRQFYGYSLTPDFVLGEYRFTPDHVTASSASSGIS